MKGVNLLLKARKDEDGTQPGFLPFGSLRNKIVAFVQIKSTE